VVARISNKGVDMAIDNTSSNELDNCDSLAGRMRYLILATTQGYRRNKELEEKTNIAAERWNAFMNGRQRPTAEMIEAFAKLHPQWSQWLGCGRVTVEGQITPMVGEHISRALPVVGGGVLSCPFCGGMPEGVWAGVDTSVHCSNDKCVAHGPRVSFGQWQTRHYAKSA
jgi:hypothetical protein